MTLPTWRPILPTCTETRRNGWNAQVTPVSVFQGFVTPRHALSRLRGL